MAEKQVTVFLKPAAENQLTAIAIYIETKGYPDIAEKFAERLYAFAESLANFPLKYPLCRKVSLSKEIFVAQFLKVITFLFTKFLPAKYLSIILFIQAG